MRVHLILSGHFGEPLAVSPSSAASVARIEGYRNLNRIGSVTANYRSHRGDTGIKLSLIANDLIRFLKETA